MKRIIPILLIAICLIGLGYWYAVFKYSHLYSTQILIVKQYHEWHINHFGKKRAEMFLERATTFANDPFLKQNIKKRVK